MLVHIGSRHTRKEIFVSSLSWKVRKHNPSLFHTSSPVHKKSEKRIKMMLNDPSIQGMLKVQKQREMFLKNKELQEEQGVKPSERQKQYIYLLSTEFIAEPALPLKLPTFTRINMKYQFQRLVNFFMSYVVDPIRTSNWLRKNNLPKIKPKHVFKRITELYVKFNSDLAAGNITDMTEYCSETAVRHAQTIQQVRQPNPDIEYRWEADKIKVSRLSYRLLVLPPPMKKHFLQVSCKITSLQTMKIISKKTQQVLGGVTEPTQVVDYFGFEKNLETPASPWLIVSKFDVEEFSQNYLAQKMADAAQKKK